MKKKLWILICIIILGTNLFGVEVEFEQGTEKEAQLLDGGRVRISEAFKLEKPSKEVTINDFSEDVRMESIVVENEEIEDIIFSVKKGGLGRIESRYLGKEVVYNKEKYTLLSLTPLIIEKKNDGKIIINPSGEMEVDAIETVDRRNKVKITGKKPMEKLKLSYEYDELQWRKIYSLNIDTKTLENVVILKNDTSRDLRNVTLNLGLDQNKQLNLEPYAEKKLDVWKREIKLQKTYSYKVSTDANHPEIILTIKGEQLQEGTDVRVIKDGRYIGNILSLEEEKDLKFKGLVDNSLDIVKENTELKFGEKFSRNSIEISMKNYKKEAVLLEVVYDELPEKWHEMKSDLPYEIKKEGILFKICVPGNSRKNLNFSYIMEKI